MRRASFLIEGPALPLQRPERRINKDFGQKHDASLPEAKSRRRDDGSGQAAKRSVALRPRVIRLAGLIHLDPIRWRPCADPGQKRDLGDWMTQKGIDSSRPVTEALLWQNPFAPVFFKDLFLAVWTSLRRRPKDEIDYGVTYGRHCWLRRRSVDSFFSAPRVRGDDVAGRRRRSLSSGRGDEDPAMIAPRSDQVQVPPSTADALAHKSILP
jgi:hypothetical protein